MAPKPFISIESAFLRFRNDRPDARLASWQTPPGRATLNLWTITTWRPDQAYDTQRFQPPPEQPQGPVGRADAAASPAARQAACRAEEADGPGVLQGCQTRRAREEAADGRRVQPAIVRGGSHR